MLRKIDQEMVQGTARGMARETTLGTALGTALEMALEIAPKRVRAMMLEMSHEMAHEMARAMELETARVLTQKMPLRMIRALGEVKVAGSVHLTKPPEIRDELADSTLAQSAREKRPVLQGSGPTLLRVSALMEVVIRNVVRRYALVLLQVYLRMPRRLPWTF